MPKFNKIKWYCFCWLFHRFTLYYRMKAVLWTKQEYHKKLKQELEKAHEKLEEYYDST